jgi:glucose-6-phosphate 1-epimerase
MVKELQKKFGIDKQLRFELDPHDMPRAIIKTDLAEAIIYLNGAHITHYQPAGHAPVLFLSSKSNFIPGKAIRGGIPIIYPWFGPKKDDPTAPMHGFARTSQWQVESTIATANTIQLKLSLNQLRFTISIGRNLHVSLEVYNDSSAPLTFEEALHTYLAVSDVRTCIIAGLTGQTFIDKTANHQRKVDDAHSLRLQGETDRVYVNSETDCRIIDPIARRYINILKHNSATTVVWNPWIEKAKKMSDFGDDEWQNMLCVESANAADNAITVAPGATHSMSATLSVQSLNHSMIQ